MPRHRHLVCDPTASPDMGMLCRHCGARKIIALPIGTSDFVRIVNRFTRKHGKCPPPARAAEERGL